MSYHSKSWPMRQFFRFVIWPVEACLMVLILLPLRLMPAALAGATTGGILAFIGPKTKWHKRARQHLNLALPDLSPAETEEILHQMWWNLGRNLGEYQHIDRFMEKGWVTIKGRENLDAAKSGGFVVGAHLGNWEIIPYPPTLNDQQIGVVYRPMNNPYASLIFKLRGRNPRIQTYEKGRPAALGMLKTIQQKNIMVLLTDQQLREGVEAPFFGKIVATPAAHIKIAQKYQVPIIPTRIRRLGPARIEVHFQAPVYVPKDAPDSVITDYARQFNQIFEDWIKDDPSQWLWPHRRWGKDI